MEKEKVQQMADAILELVTERETVTFAELVNYISGFSGEYQLSHGRPNVVIWPSASETAADALNQLRAENKIFMHPANILSYICDGVVPNMPVAKRIPNNGYKKPRWLPVCFCTYPIPDRR